MGSFIFVFILITLVILVFSIVTALRPIGQIIRIRRAPTVPIAALPHDGPAEVFGRAAGSDMSSPLTQTACLFWQVEVQEYRSSGKSGRWRTIFRQASVEPFEIDDGAGRVQILPSGAELTLVADARAASGLFGNMTGETLAALERLGVQTTGFLGFGRRLRAYERVITGGDQVYALGHVERIGGAPLLRSLPDAPLLLADRSEKDLLLSLYARIAIAALVPLVALGIILFVLLSMRGGF